MAMLEINLRPDKRTLKTFGFIALAGFGLLAGIIYWRNGLFGLDFGRAAGPVSGVLGILALLSAVCSLFAPSANRPLYVALVLLTYPIGFVLSHVFLGLVFFGVLTPVGLVFRLRGRDSLKRRFDPQAKTYWVPHRPTDSMERYFRQF